jgi:alpha,alpha-trehalase
LHLRARIYPVGGVIMCPMRGRPLEPVRRFSGCRARTALLSFLLLTVAANPAQQAAIPPPSDAALLAAVTADFNRLAPQTIHPAQGVIQHAYLTPGGYYRDLWDWDGYFIGAHWANQDAANAKYLRDWVLSFAAAADADGYVAGCISPSGPRALFGKFAMKPFLAQGALLAAEKLGNDDSRDSWLRAAWPAMQRIEAYRKRTQYDAHWKLWFWDNAMQSGADNSASLTNDPNDRSAILAVDASVFAMREDEAMAALARRLGYAEDARRYQDDAETTRRAILASLWEPKEGMFLNRRRDNGAWVRPSGWSNFVPLAEGLLPQAEGARVIREHLLNPAEMRSPYGFRSLAESDPAYNNDAIINPYSNWRGPIWMNASYLDWIALRRYGFRKEARWLAVTLAAELDRDIARWGSMHEDYDAETGDGLAPTPAQSPHGVFAGFVGWNLLAQDMLQCEVTGTHCMTLSVDESGKDASAR